MNADGTLDRSSTRKSPTLMQAIAAGIALITLAYGIDYMAGHSSWLPAEAAAALFEHPTTDMSTATLRTADAPGPASTGESLPQREDGPRECAPARGIADACTYN